MATIDIGGLSKAKVLAALCNATPPRGMGVLCAKPVVSEGDAADQLSKSEYVDYCFGRPIKIDFGSEFIETWGYDRDAGHGAAERVIASIRR